jgi:putative ABC transport system permease protein
MTAEAAGGHRWDSWRAAARAAGRELGRRPGRTVLVVVLVAAPVAAMVIALATARHRAPGAEEIWERTYGHADLADSFSYTNRVDPIPLPPGSQSMELVTSDATAYASGAPGTAVALVELPLGDPPTAGMVTITDGRAPVGPDEVLVAPSVARQLGVGVGGMVGLGESSTTRSVTGIGFGASTGTTGVLRDGFVLIAPSGTTRRRDRSVTRLVALDPTLPPGELDAWLRHERDELRVWLIRPGLAVDPAVRGFEDNFIGGIRADASIGPVWACGGAAMAVLGLLIVAAFSTGPRAGGRVRLLEGAGIGGAGAAVGLLAAAAVLVARPTLVAVDAFDAPVAGADLRPVDVAAVIGAAVLLAVMAVLPASSAKVSAPVMPERPVPRTAGAPRPAPVGALAAGLLILAGGGLVAGVLGLLSMAGTLPGSGAVLAGSMALMGCEALFLGVIPAVLGLVLLLEPLAGRTPARWAEALRNVARRRGHSTALVCALIAVISPMFALGTVAVRWADHPPTRRGAAPSILDVPRTAVPALTAAALVLTLVVLVIGLLPVRTGTGATAGRQGYVLALLGCLLALPVGWLPMNVLSSMVAREGVLFPVQLVSVILVIVPVAAGLVAAAGGRAGLWLRPLTAQSGNAA